MSKNELKLETKCYDANEYGYLYGLNQKIPDEEFEKIKGYMRKFSRKDFVDGIVKVTGRPEKLKMHLMIQFQNQILKTKLTTG